MSADCEVEVVLAKEFVPYLLSPVCWSDLIFLVVCIGSCSFSKKRVSDEDLCVVFVFLVSCEFSCPLEDFVAWSELSCDDEEFTPVLV
jgi:hypothetical protein